MWNLNLNLNLTDCELPLADAEPQVSGEDFGVAIIGLDAKAGSALNQDALWQAFREGLDMVTELPEGRIPDAENFARVAYGKQVEAFSQRAYLPAIDQFEPGLFKLSHREAELMDPTQRLYLTSVWTALEDAGYGGSRLSGSRTGVYVGYNQVGDSYESLLADAPEETVGLKVSGNVTSFMASRISYLLDLTGPAMVIDTACSSSLVALHEACKALRDGEVDMAVAGSIRIFLCPEKTGENMGTGSADERTRSFDASADGTGGGEGVINLILKPLRAAVRDRDHIYAVIKGSAVNQDGSSIGITAPNSAAQERCLTEAWEQAGIHPEDISYLEAHGTATRLGDPVEIGGITAAFCRYTSKKQFCALGAAKSNFGHLDCCSGLLGVVKVLLMMEHRMLPPSLHFTAPNSKIDYVDSPIFMNDTLRPWESDSGILTAGVSSFGLSGTNCHVVLQSYDLPHEPKTLALTHQILTVSAATEESLRRYLLHLQTWLRGRQGVCLEDLCYSLNVGRARHNHRFAMVLWDLPQFLGLKEEELLSSSYYHHFRLSSAETADPGLLSPAQRKAWTDTAAAAMELGDLETLAKAYLQGADLDFAPLYEGACVRMLSLPPYAFREERCWYTSRALREPLLPKESLHPLLDRCVTESYGLRVYEKIMSLDRCMELREHRINGVCVLPGTVYAEQLYEVGRRHFGSIPFCIRSLTFLELLTCKEEEERILHCIAREEGSEIHVRMASKGEKGQWICHAEGILAPASESVTEHRDLTAILSSHSQVLTEGEEQSFVQLGQHWHTGLRFYTAEESVVLHSRIPEEFAREAEAYTLYPPLLDGSVNSGIYLLDGQYLPLNYTNMQIHAPLRGDVYSVITRLKHKEQGEQIAQFRVELLSGSGDVLGEIPEYSLKRVNEAQDFLTELSEQSPMYDITWQKLDQSLLPTTDPYPSAAVILHREDGDQDLLKELGKRFSSVIHLIPHHSYRELSGDRIYVPMEEEQWKQVLLPLGDLRSFLFLNLLGYTRDTGDAEGDMEDKLHSVFCWIKSLSAIPGQKQLRVLTLNATKVSGTEDFYCPMNQALIGFCSCVESEQSDMDLHVIDADLHSSPSLIADALCTPTAQFVTALRKDELYLEQLHPYTGESQAIGLKDEDVILITGGLGGIGLSVAEEILSGHPQAKLLLLSRSAVGKERARERLRPLQEQGCHVRILEADVTDRNALPAVLSQIRRDYGHLDLVIHGAGVAGDGMLIHKDWSTALKVLRPKTVGTALLDELTREDGLRAMILFSSFTSAVGAPGQTDYTGANAFLDSFTYERNRRGRRTVCINWTGWKESGMAHDYGVQWQSSFVHFLTDQEGKGYFKAAMHLGGARMLACSFPEGIPTELGSRFLLPTGQEARHIAKEPESAPEEMPVIYGKSPDKLTQIEKNIALAWARTLHVGEVNLYDKFFEAGGNSLLASYLQKEINRIYPDAMAITDVFVYSTVSDIAAYIAGKLEPPKQDATLSQNGADIEALVQKYMDGELSLDDLENLV